MTPAELTAVQDRILDEVHELASDPVADPEAVRAK